MISRTLFLWLVGLYICPACHYPTDLCSNNDLQVWKICFLFDDSSNSTFATLGLNVNHLLVVQSFIIMFKSFGITI